MGLDKKKDEVKGEFIRIQKYISDCGIMSRRAAEHEIRLGNVKINGVCAEIGGKVDPLSDIVTVRGERIRGKERKLTVMLNKPAGYITTLSDEYGRKCVADLVSDYGIRLNPVGRLDKDSEGLLLMTSDGMLLQHLTHPRYSLPKVYIVTLDAEINDSHLERLRAPMKIDGYNIRPVQAEILEGQSGNRTVLRMTLHEGRNRQIRKMCAAVGLSVIRLERIAVGQLTLEDLQPGESRPLTAAQLDYLYSALNL